MTEYRVTVIGAGPGGVAAAAGITERGHYVTLASRTPERLRTIEDAGGIRVEDAGETRTVALRATTTDLPAAAADSPIVLVAVPAFGQEEVVSVIAPYLAPDAVLVLMPGSCGSLIAADLLRAAGRDPLRDVLLAETITLPYSGRMTGSNSVRIVLPSRLRAAAFPATRNSELHERLDSVLDLLVAPNVLDPGLNNPNFLIHPAPMLLNFAEVERRDGRLSIMNEGMTPAVLRCLDAMDQEKMAVCQALGLEAVSIDRIYTEAGGSPSVYRSPGEPFNLTDRIWPRYVSEDVPFGSVMIASFARHLGVPAPVAGGVSDVLAAATGEDFWGEGRTIERLGLAGLAADAITSVVESGERVTVTAGPA